MYYKLLYYILQNTDAVHTYVQYKPQFDGVINYL